MPQGWAQRIVFTAAALVLAALAALAGLLVARSAGARGYPVSQLKEGVNAANLQITPMFVVRDGSFAFAIRPFTPGGGTDPVAWCPKQGFFEAWSTGAKFGVDGAYIAGPASRGLDRYASTIVNGVLTVDPTKVDPGPPRGPAAPATKLPSCDWSTALFPPGVVPEGSPTPQPG